MATVADLLAPVVTDLSAVAADQVKLSADQSQLVVDDNAFVAALASAGVTAFSVVSVDGKSVSTYTVSAGATPPYTVAVTPTAGSITIPDPVVPPVPATV